MDPDQPYTLLHIILVQTVCYGTCKSKKEGRDQKTIQSSTTPEQGYKGKVPVSQLDITNKSQEVNPFPAGDHKASTNGRAWKYNKARYK